MKKSQKQRILELLSDDHWHNTIEMNKIAFRYGAILHVLRKEGYVFDKKRDPNYPDNVIEMWKIEHAPYVPKPEYKLAPEGDHYIHTGHSNPLIIFSEPEPLPDSRQAELF